MNVLYRQFVHIFVALVLGFAAPVALAAELQPGRDFMLVEPRLAVDDKQRIEVIEFFWYGCGHCNDFEPLLESWRKKLPADVVFRRVPAVFPNMKWAPGAKLFYTIEIMGLTDRLHAKAFHAIHEERLRLDDDFVLLDWVARQGVDRARFKAVLTSPEINTRIQQARALTVTSGITGTPSIIVQGRYQALTTGNYGNLLGVVEQLIDRARREAAAGK